MFFVGDSAHGFLYVLWRGQRSAGYGVYANQVDEKFTIHYKQAS